jgi:hypothetical protein
VSKRQRCEAFAPVRPADPNDLGWNSRFRNARRKNASVAKPCCAFAATAEHKIESKQMMVDSKKADRVAVDLCFANLMRLLVRPFLRSCFRSPATPSATI